jgi:hypothetical protein
LEDVVSEVGSSASSTADFERFVYVDVAIEPNGMELSVLSALSRRGLDPWQEAQPLAQLPRLAAADGLAQILRAVPAVQSLRLDVKVIAERLVALLPVAVTAGSLPSKLSATPVQIPRGLTLVMMAAMFGGMLVPLFMPKQAEPVAPASWIADVPKAPVKPQAILAQPAPSTLPDHPGAPVTTRGTPPPMAGKALQVEKTPGEVERHIDRTHGVPAIEAAMGGDHGIEQLGHLSVSLFPRGRPS